MEMATQENIDNEIHLLVFQHGLWGNPSHLDYVITQLSNEYKDLEILNIDANKKFNTYDGIDVCGERAVEAILKHVKELETPASSNPNTNGHNETHSSDDLLSCSNSVDDNGQGDKYVTKDEKKNVNKNPKKLQKRIGTIKVTRVSFIGYSLGGLILRYTIGKLLTLKFFDKVTPIHFVTFATPHLGSARPPHLSIFNRIYNNTAAFLTFRTGKQLNLFDSYHDGHPLLYVLTNPHYPFLQALKIFKYRLCYSNVRNDRVVRYTTSSIDYTNLFRKHAHIVFDPKYPSLIKVDTTKPLEKESWKPKEIGILLIFLCLVPLLFPIWITLMTSVMVPVRLFRPIFYPVPKIDTDWIEDFFVCKEKKRIKDDIVIEKIRFNHIKLRHTMVGHLNTMTWERHAVSLRFTNAHAAMISRNPRFSAFKDVVQHFIDHFHH